MAKNHRNLPHWTISTRTMHLELLIVGGMCVSKMCPQHKALQMFQMIPVYCLDSICDGAFPFVQDLCSFMTSGK